MTMEMRPLRPVALVAPSPDRRLAQRVDRGGDRGRGTAGLPAAVCQRAAECGCTRARACSSIRRHSVRRSRCVRAALSSARSSPSLCATTNPSDVKAWPVWQRNRAVPSSNTSLSTPPQTGQLSALGSPNVGTSAGPSSCAAICPSISRLCGTGNFGPAGSRHRRSSRAGISARVTT